MAKKPLSLRLGKKVKIRLPIRGNTLTKAKYDRSKFI